MVALLVREGLNEDLFHMDKEENMGKHFDFDFWLASLSFPRSLQLHPNFTFYCKGSRHWWKRDGEEDYRDIERVTKKSKLNIFHGPSLVSEFW